VQVKTGHSDAAVVWDAIAAQYADSTEAIVIPPEQNIAAPVAVAVLKFSSQGPVAERFAAFLASDRGQAIFQRHHFTTARPASMSGDRR
jgi:ABC-type molybdate transport system substrate-binding protein